MTKASCLNTAIINSFELLKKNILLLNQVTKHITTDKTVKDNTAFEKATYKELSNKYSV